METVLITGGTGLVGGRLTDLLIERGYRVAHLSRTSSNPKDVTTYVWDIQKGELDQEALENADYIIHLAGAPLDAKRWTENYKKEIISSRVESANLIFAKAKDLKNKPKAFISASAVGYYGAVTSEKIFTEEDGPANDFLGKTCHVWEAAAGQFRRLGMRSAMIRTATVLSDEGGALEMMEKPVKLCIGAAVGSGKQWLPWIHLEDLCRTYLKAIEDEILEGPYNAAAPDHITNKAFMKTLAKALNKPFFMPNVPGFVMRLLFGEMGDVLLKGSRVSSEKIIKSGFSFNYPELEQALRAIYHKE